MPRVKTEAKERAILEAAAKVFAMKPFHGVLIDEIASDAGIGKGTIYRYFETKDELYAWFTPEGGANADSERDPIHGGFALAHWSGDPEIEKKLKADLGVTLRCIPLVDEHGPGTCPFTGKPSKQRVVWAKSY